MMKKKLIFIFLMLFLPVYFAFCQQVSKRSCATMEVLKVCLERDPRLASKMENVERFTRRTIQNNDAQRRVDGVITIPIVVHIIYQTDIQNISDAQVQSQIEVLNADFRRQNLDINDLWPQAADTEIEFCLANVDPEGNSTTGITRTFNSRSQWGAEDDMKYASKGGVDAWPSSDYLNMWVCNIGRGILGYAQFPGSGPDATDGVVMSPQYFGTIGSAQAPFDGGRTTTHEVGHWLNLRHIWGDGNCNEDDFVEDTPASDAANFGCATGHISCSSIDMVQNYMDYSDDSCMNLFTTGQKQRMRALFETGGYRESILNSSGCGNGSSNPVTSCNDGIQNQNETGIDCGGPCPACTTGCNGTEVSIEITFDDYPEETSWIITNESGTTVASGDAYNNQADGSTINIVECLPKGCYDFTIKDAYGDGLCCSYGNGTYLVTGGSNTLASGSSYGDSETTNFCLGTATSCNDGIQNQGETGIDCGGPCPACPSTGCEGTAISIAITFDDYPEETSWLIKDNGDTTIASGEAYDNQTDGSTLFIEECLLDGCYTFIINDAFGDGICCSYGNGTYTITGNGNTIATGSSFTTSETTNFCLGSETSASCDTPENLSISNLTATTGTLEWSPVSGAVSYDIEVLVDGSSYPFNSASNSLSIEGFVPGITYSFRVKTNCEGESSPWSTYYEFIIPTESDGGTGCNNVTINTENFETGWGIWNDGGADCYRNNYAAYATSGTYTIRVRDNTASSVLTSDNLNLSNYQELTVAFSYYPVDMDTNEDFWLQISTDGGNTYTTIKTWVKTTDFDDRTSYSESVTITDTFTSNTKIRFRVNASVNNDRVYFDDITISGCEN